MNYRGIAFFDLDGTLLNENSQVSSAVANGIDRLRDNQILPVIATGRTEAEIPQILNDTKITSNIVMNGSFIRVNGDIIHREIIDKTTIEKMLQLTKENQQPLAFYNHSNYWATQHNDDLVNAYQYIHSQLPEINPNAYLEREVNMLLVLGQDKDETYHEAFPELTFYRNGPYSIDIVKKNVSKGQAVRKLIEILQLENVPTYGFGDGLNDLALLEACDYKIAMGNAKKELKEMADFITLTNQEDGIVHALKTFDLI